MAETSLVVLPYLLMTPLFMDAPCFGTDTLALLQGFLYTYYYDDDLPLTQGSESTCERYERRILAKSVDFYPRRRGAAAELRRGEGCIARRTGGGAIDST